jgi:hypothetical protein
MKAALGFITLGIWALSFVVFFAALKPDVVIAVTGSGPRCRSTQAPAGLAGGSHRFVAASLPDPGHR